MTDSVFESVERSCAALKLDFCAQELATLAEDQGLSTEGLQAVALVLNYLSDKKTDTTIQTLLRLSHLPRKNPKTFESFDFSVIRGRDVERLKNLSSLSAIYAHRNLAFIGPAGTGKTHLAQAFGYKCCTQGIKAYFIKMSELRDKLTAARRTGKEYALVSHLVRQSCLIIDEVGHCEFDKENTRLFFDLFDRRYNKEGAYNIVFTSNKMPSMWRENFNEDDALLCALDRIFDDAMVFRFKGESFRGRKLDTINLHTGRVKGTGLDYSDSTI